MPYEFHPELNTPPDDTVLWRYMDFARFLNLLETRAVWFSRSDQFEDPLEGTHTDAELRLLKELPVIAETGENMSAQYIRLANTMRKAGYVSCWRSSPGESLAMWDLYGKGSGIIALKTTVGRLKAQLNRNDFRVFLAQVQYLDWDSTGDSGNTLVMYARKELSYEHEAEVRAIIWGILSFPGLYSDPESPKVDEGMAEPPLGLSIATDPTTLITEVVIGPREKPWVRGLVESVLKRYGLDIPVSTSNRLTPR